MLVQLEKFIVDNPKLAGGVAALAGMWAQSHNVAPAALEALKTALRAAGL